VSGNFAIETLLVQKKPLNADLGNYIIFWQESGKNVI